ncbi:uncharacterized protein LOC130015682 [Mercurialis annua]|uniref:uncharacterized protein LOC130015682 n=1 Tax=Mercurialis annua TaxID=3986 RepID=UPI0024AFC5E6|nr:uncharacterized protein LOC130015682 [Mercurialis annua]
MSSITQIFILFLIFSAASMAPQAKADRCSKELDPKSCDLLTCRQQCPIAYQGKHASGFCKFNSESQQYSCFCAFDC